MHAKTFIYHALLDAIINMQSVDVGNKDLSEQCESAVELMKKGLPFVPSLYLR